jgi:hypothetical protein
MFHGRFECFKRFSEQTSEILMFSGSFPLFKDVLIECLSTFDRKWLFWTMFGQCLGIASEISTVFDLPSVVQDWNSVFLMFYGEESVSKLTLTNLDWFCRLCLLVLKLRFIVCFTSPPSYQISPQLSMNISQSSAIYHKTAFTLLELHSKLPTTISHQSSKLSSPQNRNNLVISAPTMFQP